MNSIYFNLQNIVRNFFTKGHPRSIKAKKNIVASFVFRFGNIGIAFLLVPMALNYLDPTRYGIWLAISSIVAWFEFLDIGIGHGLRNKFAEMLAKGNKTMVRTYVSTAYAILGIFCIIFLVIILGISPIIEWTYLLNTPSIMSKELKILAIITFGCFSLRIVLKLVTKILLADQRTAVRDFIQIMGNILILVVIYLLINITSGSLIYLGLAYSIAPIIILVLASIFLYSKDYKEFVPSIKYVNFHYSKDILNLGIKFFFIQICTIILLSTDNIIIIQLFDPTYVTTYQIAHKYFFVIIIGFSTIISPFWSAVTEAYYKKDIIWIKNSIGKILYIWLGIVGLTVFMTIISNWVYSIWIGDVVSVPLSLSIGMGLFVIIRTFNSPFSSFLNGVGKIKLQMYGLIFVGIINIPLSVILAKYFNFGISGVIYATFLCFTFLAFLRFIQYYKLINNKAYGIWNK